MVETAQPDLDEETILKQDVPCKTRRCPEPATHIAIASLECPCASSQVCTPCATKLARWMTNRVAVECPVHATRGYVISVRPWG